MEMLTEMLAGWTVPIAVLMLVATGAATMLAWAQNYHTVSPNQVAVVSGRSRRMGDGRVGYRVITGGGFLKLPVVERVDYLLLNVMNFQVEVKGVPAKGGALVNVVGNATVKVLSSAENLPLAVERFLGYRTEQIQAVAKENLEANLRSIVGQTTIEDLNEDRQVFQQKVIHEAAGDLAKLGLGLDLLNIQHVTDDKNYIASLGKARTAQVVRDAAIGEAEAQRETAIKTAEAQRQSAQAKAQADQAISDAERERDTVKAKNQAQVEAERARVSIAAQVAAAQETQKLNIAQVEADRARVRAETELQEDEQKRKDAELRATVIVAAEREKDARLIRAQAEQEAATREGEALRVRAEKEGQGTQARMVAEATGRKAAAAALQAGREAEAAGDRARLTAEADGQRAKLLAEAEGTKAKLLAEAEGAMAKAEAFKALDEGGRFLLILEASTPAIDALGKAVGTALAPMAESVGQALGGIDEVRVIDFGGANGKGPLESIGQFPIETVSKLVAQLRAAGLTPALQALAQQAGFRLEAAASDNGGAR